MRKKDTDLNYEETLLELHNTPRLPKEKNLDRMRLLMELLGNPETELSLIHVAGTNGKGSISRMLEEVLLQSGYKTGLFTSPFIFDFRERIQINNEMIPKDKVVYYYEKVEEACQKVIERGQLHPSEFEVVVAMCLLFFKDEKVDLGIIEVGIGGLYDATNIISPILSVIASINYDHMDILGKSLEEIAVHKAGIIKHNPTVSYSQYPEVRKILIEKAKLEGSKLVFASSKEITFLSMEGSRQIIKYVLPGKEDIIVKLNLLGIHQMLNCGVVLLAIEELRKIGFSITDERLKKALEDVKWPGRMDMISSEPLIIIDGAHNMDGAINLRESMAFYFRDREIILILGILGDKDVESIASVLSKDTKITLCITPEYYRGKNAKELYGMIKDQVRAESCDTYDEAVKRSLELYKEGDVILVAGSLYIIGDIEKAFKAHL
ncbi:MAG: folylpolyglutamate synthase/dihydrofolate synthase family protein [Clostridiaceae bacterium]